MLIIKKGFSGNLGITTNPPYLIKGQSYTVSFAIERKWYRPDIINTKQLSDYLKWYLSNNFIILGVIESDDLLITISPVISNMDVPYMRQLLTDGISGYIKKENAFMFPSVAYKGYITGTEKDVEAQRATEESKKPIPQWAKDLLITGGIVVGGILVVLYIAKSGKEYIFKKTLTE